MKSLGRLSLLAICGLFIAACATTPRVTIDREEVALIPEASAREYLEQNSSRFLAMSIDGTGLGSWDVVEPEEVCEFTNGKIASHRVGRHMFGGDFKEFTRTHYFDYSDVHYFLHSGNLPGGKWTIEIRSKEVKSVLVLLESEQKHCSILPEVGGSSLTKLKADREFEKILSALESLGVRSAPYSY